MDQPSWKSVIKFFKERHLLRHTDEELAVLSPEFLAECADNFVYIIYHRLPESVRELEIIKECLRCEEHYKSCCFDGPPPMRKSCYVCKI